mmetsp:Transcript_35397/g.36064  ORF Transcript_35397/g.36064 Transcript_35397/m.36064 type:complete len:204 (+) Transcript_35397:1212-1823(+)
MEAIPSRWARAVGIRRWVRWANNHKWVRCNKWGDQISYHRWGRWDNHHKWDRWASNSRWDGIHRRDSIHRWDSNHMRVNFSRWANSHRWVSIRRWVPNHKWVNNEMVSNNIWVSTTVASNNNSKVVREGVCSMEAILVSKGCSNIVHRIRWEVSDKGSSSSRDNQGDSTVASSGRYSKAHMEVCRINRQADSLMDFKHIELND